MAGSDWGASRPDLATSVVDLVNAHRRSLGLVELGVSPTLTASATWKSRHMARYSYLAHDDPAPPVSRSVEERLAACGYPATTSAWGENIADGQTTPQSVMQAWLSSAGHRANIERAGFRAIGVGVAASASGRLEWTQDFGSQLDASSLAPAPQPPPSPAPPPPAAAPPPAPPTSPAPQPEPAGRTSSIVSPAPPVLSESAFAPGPAAPARVSAPRVLITRAPAALSASAAARFSWIARGAVTTTTCALDGRRPRRCRPAVRYSGLARGRRHTFAVTVSGPGGTATARHSWRIRGLHRLQQ